MDTFSNSVLHIAASLGAAPSYLTSMIFLGAEVHKLNNGDQTFLHLINLSNVAILREFPALLGALVKRGFDFEQQDHNGQTPLHALTQHMTPWKMLSGILQSFQYHGIPLPISRDNRGYTVAEQLRDQNFILCWPYNPDPSSIPNITQQSTLASNLNPIEYPKIDPELLTSTTPSALQEYAKHACLLKTIIRSFTNPLYEDNSGRNGLHCLFEVRLDLPTSSPTSTITELTTPLEQYATHLLSLGVDPNHYSKCGITPLHALLQCSTIHPSQTHSILTLLLSHKPNIHARTLTGLTALHISVSTGNIPCTKLLLEHKANVHARTNTSEGIVALGIRESSRMGDYEGLYARIQACVCLVVNEGGVAKPTVLNEWALGGFRVLPDSEVGREVRVGEYGEIREGKEDGQRNGRVVGRESVFGKRKSSPLVKILQRW
jgi:ankyrin repeat protein